MSGERVGVIRLAGPVLVVTTPLPQGVGVSAFALDPEVEVFGGDGYFILVDHLADATDPTYVERESDIVRHAWYRLFNWGLAPDSEPPQVVDGDPRDMLRA